MYVSQLVSKKLYAIPAWAGFLSAYFRDLISSFLRQLHRYGFHVNVITIEQLLKGAGEHLFQKALNTSNCLYHPPKYFCEAEAFCS